MEIHAEDRHALVTLLVAVAQALEKSLGASAAAVMKQAGGLAAQSLPPGGDSTPAAGDAWTALLRRLTATGLFGTVEGTPPDGDAATLRLERDLLAELCHAAATDGGMPAALCHLNHGLIEHCIRRVTGRRCRVEISAADPGTGARQARVRFYD